MLYEGEKLYEFRTKIPGSFSKFKIGKIIGAETAICRPKDAWAVDTFIGITSFAVDDEANFTPKAYIIKTLTTVERYKEFMAIVKTWYGDKVTFQEFEETDK